MLLVTGGTGFIGRSVLRHLSESGVPVRTLLRPSHRSPKLPRGVATEVALAALSDRRGLRAALVGVEAVIHLAGAERHGSPAELETTDVEGTRNLVEAAADAGVRRLIYVSHLGAARSSAYPLMRAKALAEESIRQSRVPHTILRSAVVFGPGDAFTTWLAMFLAAVPFVFPLPGDGSTALQPIWVEDLATAIAWVLEDPARPSETHEIGGPEYLTFLDVARMVMKATGHQRTTLPVPPPYLRAAARLLRSLMPAPPISPLWFDYLAVSRTTELGALPRFLGLQPARMETRLDYLRGQRWGRELVARQFRAQNRPAG